MLRCLHVVPAIVDESTCNSIDSLTFLKASPWSRLLGQEESVPSDELGEIDRWKGFLGSLSSGKMQNYSSLGSLRLALARDQIRDEVGWQNAS